MVSVAFFFSIFASVAWGIYAFNNASEGNVSEFTLLIAVVVVPILVLWFVFGYIYQYNNASVLNKNMFTLFKQMKKTQEYTDAIAKMLLEARDSVKDSTILNKFDMFVLDMNELLADIIKRGNLCSSEQIDNLWVKVNNGGKWAFGKVLIELYQNQPALPSKLLQKSLQDTVLSGTILEFCSRYQNLVNILERHDKERIFLNVLETGVFGKVFSLLAGPADSVRQNRDLSLTHQQLTEESDFHLEEPSKNFTLVVEEEITPNLSEQKIEPTSEEAEKPSLSENARKLFVETFTKKRASANREEMTDPLSLAFAKSFGEEKTENSAEPSPSSDLQRQSARQEDENEETSKVSVVSPSDAEEKTISRDFSAETLEEESPAMPDIVLESDAPSHLFAPAPSVVTPEIEKGFENTQNRLATLKREWEEAKQRDLTARKEPSFDNDEGMPEPKVSNDENFSYPFGGWTDADKYNK